MQTISLHNAQQFVLHCQLLTLDSKLSGKDGTLQAIRQLGYVQIDTISVIERAHHHVLWTRIPDYKHTYLHDLGENDRAVFDYWAHAASFLPMEHYPYSLIQKAKVDNGSGFWRITEPKLAAHVLKRLKKEGPLMAKDFVKAKDRPDEPWRVPTINMVIRQLFMKGEIMVSKRRGILKTYDLPERVLPKGIGTTAPSLSKFAEHIVHRDLRAQGLIKLSEFGHLMKIPRKEYQTALKKMLKTEEVVEVNIKGMGDEPYFAYRDAFQQFSPTNKKTFHILSPFDNLVIQRKRLAELFGFQYTLECYVTAAKRKFGYFGLPLLYGNKFVGQLDAKADRKEKVLHIRKLEWTAKPSATLKRAYEKKLKAFATFCGCEHVKT